MLKQYLKQAIQIIRENRLVSCISVLGTAISIAMIMVVILVMQIQLVNYYPEDKRDRMLYLDVGSTHVASNDHQRESNGNMSVETAKACFYSLETPETVSLYCGEDFAFSLPARMMFDAYPVKEVDSNFWKVFSFRFIEGNSFSEADFDAGLKQVVLSETLARRFLGSTAVVGQEILLNRVAYRICGVVKDVSKAASTAYAMAWVPYTSIPAVMRQKPDYENIRGMLSVVILAKDASDVETIRKEFETKVAQYNQTKRDYKVDFRRNPVTRWEKLRGSVGQIYVEWRDYWLETGGLLLFLIVIPALNLLGVTQSSIQKRQAEIGVRKAFGATNRDIIGQVLCENGVTTLLGGFVGLVLSLVALPICKDFLLESSNTSLSLSMLVRPSAFILALLFCLVLNLLSAGIPAWRISRKEIVEALKNNEETNK